ncbi:RNA polymerase III subunit C11, partial [Trachipleistophora hominis]
VFDKQIKERIVWKEDVMRSMAKCEKICEKCGYNTASFYEMQTRSADEPMTIFYQCLQC